MCVQSSLEPQKYLGIIMKMVRFLNKLSITDLNASQNHLGIYEDGMDIKTYKQPKYFIALAFQKPCQKECIEKHGIHASAILPLADF